MKRTIAFSVAMAVLGVGVMACDSSSSGAMAASGGGAAAGGSIGVKECDDYIAKWNACYKDPTMKAAAQPAFDQVKQSWAGMAKDPNQKAALAGACKTMVDNFPSAACK